MGMQIDGLVISFNLFKAMLYYKPNSVNSLFMNVGSEDIAINLYATHM